MSETKRSRPSGPYSIGRALEIPPGPLNDDLRLAIDAIDRVHGVGSLPRIPMEFRSQLGMSGRFDFDRETGEPIRILIDRRAAHRTFVAVHEIGHLVDLTIFGEGSIFGSTFNSMLSDWSHAVSKSKAYQNLLFLRDRKPSRHLVTRLRPEELWSRSYAQLVAMLSGSEELLEGLGTLQRRAPKDLHNPLQWEDNDFRDIAASIDAMFARLGWRT